MTDPCKTVWDKVVETAVRQQRDVNRLRKRRVVNPINAVEVEIAGRRVVNFSSNNYLGLTHHPRVIEAMRAAANIGGAGSGAAALVSGYTAQHATAEAAIRNWKASGGAVLIGSGFAANLAAVQTFAAVAVQSGRAVRFLLDKLAHASLVDAVRSAAAHGSDVSYRVFPHNGMDKLRRLLASAPAQQLQVVVTESIFSMDGDAADLAGLADLKNTFPFQLLLDEAHGSGVYGEAGAGYAAEMGFEDLADVTVITLSKAVGVSGGAICGSADFCEAVVNFGRAYLYTTNLPPSVAAGITAAIEVMRAEPQRQERLRSTAARIRRQLAALHLDVPPGDSPIVPIIVGDENVALGASAELLEAGFLVVPIRPPTVKPGTSRLRLTVSSEHTEPQIDQLLDAIARIKILHDG